MKSHTKKMSQYRTIVGISFSVVLSIAIIVALLMWARSTDTSKRYTDSISNPLLGKTFYRDDTRPITKLAESYAASGNASDAALINKIALQPGTTWLNGPTINDPLATKDSNEVSRITADANKTKTTPLFQLYAIPYRDACAIYSNGGFTTKSAYLTWVTDIINNLQTPSVFIIEADAVAHTLQPDCLTTEQIRERYDILKSTVIMLEKSPQVLATYIDAAHSEWFPDPKVIIEPLRKSGIDTATGVAVNVSNFIDTKTITTWSELLINTLKGKGVIIDMSRNGKGAAPPSATGDARWCNPSGRGLGIEPTTKTDKDFIHAYAWIKRAGESDGACNGYPAAGVLVPSLAIELAKNSQD